MCNQDCKGECLTSKVRRAVKIINGLLSEMGKISPLTSEYDLLLSRLVSEIRVLEEHQDALKN